MKRIFFSVFVALTGAGFSTPAPADAPEAQARNVIFMVADGLGWAGITAAATGRRADEGRPLRLETLPRVGYQRTRAADALVTDSAAAASAWACGRQFRNGQICPHGESGRPRSLLELARDAGRATGLVATSTVTHATPAAFGAHVRDRECERTIARQYIVETAIDVILGGGRARFTAAEPDPCGGSGDVLALARERGYTIVDDADGLRATTDARGPDRLLGLFARGELARAAGRGGAQPTLAAMTRAALAVLERDEDGLFLVIEGSQIDWAGHRNDLDWMLDEIESFDAAVGVVLDWLAADAARAGETLLIVTSDHETGGLALHEGDGRRPEPAWTTRGHTGAVVPIWSRGPGSAALARPIDNTDIYDVVRRAAGLDGGS